MKLKNVMILRQTLQLCKASFFPGFLGRFLDITSGWTSEIMISSRSVSHPESRNMSIRSVCWDLTESDFIKYKLFILCDNLINNIDGCIVIRCKCVFFQQTLRSNVVPQPSLLISSLTSLHVVWLQPRVATTQIYKQKQTRWREQERPRRRGKPCVFVPLQLHSSLWWY